MSARTAIGTAAIDVPLLLPVGDALAVALPVIDADGDPFDLRTVSFRARVFQPSDPTWEWLIPMTVTVVEVSPGNISSAEIELVATAADVATALGTRKRLRWELRNHTAGRDVLRGPVDRLADGWGIRTGKGSPVLQIGATTQILQVPAATVVPPPWVALTQAEYDALDEPDPNTLYLIVPS
jgi:hypothetical protein